MSPPDSAQLARREARARMMRRRRITVITAATVVAVLGIAGIAWAVATTAGHPDTAHAPQQTSANPQNESDNPAGTVAGAGSTDSHGNTPSYDVDSPDSITVVVNKQRPLAADWQPSDLVVPEGIANNWGDELRAEAATALQQLAVAAEADGVPVIITSGYRDYHRQAALFDGYAANDGIEAAEAYSARPGHSEHQTGLAVDLTDGAECSLEVCFGDTATGLWLRDNAWRYGFILRYEEGQQAIVGYSYEPWHFRYVGTEVSIAMHEQGEANLESFVGLPAAPGY